MQRLTALLNKDLDRVAIVLDDLVISAPIVMDTLSDMFIIQGLDDEAERNTLVAALNFPISARLTINSFTPAPPNP